MCALCVMVEKKTTCYACVRRLGEKNKSSVYDSNKTIMDGHSCIIGHHVFIVNSSNWRACRESQGIGSHEHVSEQINT